MPSPDLDETLKILNERNQALPDDIRKTNEHFVRHASNYKLAKFVVYTKGKTPAETTNETLNLLELSSPLYLIKDTPDDNPHN